MTSWCIEHYLWIKSLHIVAVTSWMAGLFYLPRLLVYHAENKDKTEAAVMLTTMASRLYRIIMRPAMLLSLATGIILAIVLQAWSSGWLHIKFLAVLMLVVFHHMLWHWHSALARGTCQRSPKFFRILNEIPTVLLIIIVIAVVIKPF